MLPLTILLALWSCALCAAPDAREIVRTSLSNGFRNEDRMARYAIEEKTAQRILDSAKHVKTSESVTKEVQLIGGEPYSRLIARNDKPLSQAEQQKEEDRLRKKTEERNRESPAERTRRLAERDRRRGKQREFLSEVPEAFDFKMVSEDLIEGRKVWVIDASPRPDYRPKTAMGAILGKFKGRLWIDELDYQWVRASCESIDAVSFGWFLARLNKGASLTFEQTRVNNDVWLPKRTLIQYDARIALLKHQTGETEITRGNYRKFQTDSQVVSISTK